ncbi:MAG: autotransporter domain-containing protein [Brevundimonas sp.]
MSRLLRGVAAGALTLAAVAFASAASAQSYDRIVAFGDSLSDNGNLFAAIGSPASPPYFQGRFSSGPVWIERLGFNVARVGGSVTGSIGYAYGGAETGTPILPPGMRNQLASYLGAGGQFDSSDLVTVWGGANNIFNNLAAAGASPSPTASITPITTAAAADIGFITNTIAGAGAGTILVANLPKLSLTPQFRNTPAAPLADFAAGGFNTALATQLNNVAAARPGTNIILMDTFKIGDLIANSPELFGLSNVTQPCFNGVTVCSNPDSYFYFDGVHPTGRGHQLIAALATDYIYYGDAGAQMAVLGETGFRHRERRLGEASAALSGREAWDTGTRITVAAHYDTTEIDARGPIAAADSEGYGGRMAVEAGLSPNWRVGLAGAFDIADLEAGAVTADVESISLDVYGGWRSESGMFVNVAAGIANENYDEISRLTGLAPVRHESETGGSTKGARIQAGTWLTAGGFSVSPRVAVDWISAGVDGWFEVGPAAAYQYQERTVEVLSAEAALRIEGDMGGFGVFAEGGYRDALDDSSDAVRTGIYGNPAQVLSRQVDSPYGGQLMFDAGIGGAITERLSFEVGYRGRFSDEADSHAGGVQLKLAL